MQSVSPLVLYRGPLHCNVHHRHGLSHHDVYENDSGYDKHSGVGTRRVVLREKSTHGYGVQTTRV